MKKGMCELCSNTSRLHCESDEARLCWECDEKVHGANFLVAKHCRSLLCHVCQSPTPWKACGPKLFPTLSVCENCFDNKDSRTEDRELVLDQPQMRDNRENEEIKNDETESDDDDGNQEHSSSDDDDDYEEYEDIEYEDVEDEDDDGENQVVPWMESS